MKQILLDTDMGPDCDDAGALGLLHILCAQQKAVLLAVTHCTSNPYGCGCIDAINRAFGKPDIPIGTLKARGFLDGTQYQAYNRALALEYPNRFGGKGEAAPPAVSVMKEALGQAADGSVTAVAIGPLTNFAELLQDAEGRALAARKCRELVCMAGCFTGNPAVEWNVEMDVPAARRVLEQWPGPLVLAPFELGADIITGVSWYGLPESHPVRRAYALFSPKGRSSWDLAAVWYALCGEVPFFALSEQGALQMGQKGETRLLPKAGGLCRCLKKQQPAEEIAAAIDMYWKNAGLYARN